MRGFVRGFLDGLRATTPVTVLATLLVAGLLAGLMLLSSPRLFATGLGLYPGHEGLQDNGFVFTRAVALAARKDSADPVFFVSGASTMREVILDAPSVEARMTAITGEDWEMVDLTSGAQSLAASRAMLTAAACGKRGVVAMAANLARFTRPPDTSHDNSVMIPQMRPVDARPDLRDRARHVRMLAATDISQKISATKDGVRGALGLHVLAKSEGEADEFGRVRHRYLAIRQTPAEATRTRQRFTRRFIEIAETGFDENAPAFAAAMTDMIEEVQACGDLRVVLVATPLNPDIRATPGMDRMEADHRRILKGIATATGAGLVYLDDEVRYELEDFYDHAHLMRMPAIVASTKAILDEVEDHMTEGDR